MSAGFITGALLLLQLGALAGCAGALPAPTAADALAAQPRWPGTSEADLGRGRAVYVRRCSACHLLHHPKDERPEWWPDLVRKMAPRAKLSPSEMEDVLRYLVVLSDAH